MLFVFSVIVALWLFRDPPNIDGWGRGFYDAVKLVSFVIQFISWVNAICYNNDSISPH